MSRYEVKDYDHMENRVVVKTEWNSAREAADSFIRLTVDTYDTVPSTHLMRRLLVALMDGSDSFTHVPFGASNHAITIRKIQ